MDTFQQALAEQVAEQHRHHGKALFFWVWGALLAMTAIEVYLTYQRMQPVKMLLWPKVSIVVLAKAVVAPVPGNVLPGVPRIDGSHVGRHRGHWVMTNW